MRNKTSALGVYNKPFIISKKKWETFIKYYSWEVKKYDLLSEIWEDEQIFVTPFSQARERWFEVNSEDEQIISIIIKEKKEFNIKEFEETFTESDSVLEKDFEEYFSKDEYKQVVREVVKKEIWNWEWSNFLVAQKVSSRIKDFDIEVWLSIFKRLLLWDYWTYLHFIFFDWEKIFIWASPERNVSIEKINNEKKVRMNPISGTFKKTWYKNYLDFKKDFLDFLQDKKEINELFMATDEELKMMSSICTSWWIIVGPILKEMANLIHTEYLLSWNSTLSTMEIFRRSMWASTVIWSPIESAFRVAMKYETFSRKYYAGAICHQENWSLDSAIMIRTLQLDIEWNLEVCVWASLVKDSNPEKEYEEINIKLAWVLNAILWKKADSISFLKEYYLDDEVQELLQVRNQNLSKIWFFKQEQIVNKKLENKKCLIVNNEDDFTNMLAHLLTLIWLDITLKRYSEIEKEELSNFDFVLVWPGPWNPTDDSKKMKINLDFIDYLNKNNIKHFWICLWNQLICRYNDIKLKKKEIPTQGEQIEIDLFWKKELVAFYNTFTWIVEEKENLEFSVNDEKQINALKWDNFFSFQFHPESILTKNWLEILERYLLKL